MRVASRSLAGMQMRGDHHSTGISSEYLSMRADKSNSPGIAHAHTAPLCVYMLHHIMCCSRSVARLLVLSPSYGAALGDADARPCRARARTRVDADDTLPEPSLEATSLYHVYCTMRRSVCLLRCLSSHKRSESVQMDLTCLIAKRERAQDKEGIA